MKKIMFYLLLVIMNGFYFCDCYAEQDLQVLTPNRQAKVAYRLLIRISY